MTGVLPIRPNEMINFLDSKFIFGGTSNFSKILEDKAVENGTEIKLNSKVVSIDCNDNISEGVTLENGDKFFGKNIIGNMNKDYQDLIQKNQID